MNTMPSDEDLLSVVQDVMDELSMRGYQATAIITMSGKTMELNGDPLAGITFYRGDAPISGVMQK